MIEHPTHRQVDHTPVEAALCELIELLDGLEILGESRRLKFWIDAPQIVTIERGVRPHASAQQSSTERAIAQRRDAVGAGIGQDLRLDGALE